MAIAKKRKISSSVDEYLDVFPPAARSMLGKIRSTIKATAPQAEELISYGIPGYKYKGMLIYFAGFKNHVSVYPAPRTDPALAKELLSYGGGKGTVQFPLDKPLPLALIKKIVRYRIKANEEKAATKKTVVRK